MQAENRSLVIAFDSIVQLLFFLPITTNDFKVLGYWVFIETPDFLALLLLHVAVNV